MVPLQGADAGSNPVQGIKAYNSIAEYPSDTRIMKVQFFLGLYRRIAQEWSNGLICRRVWVQFPLRLWEYSVTAARWSPEPKIPMQFRIFPWLYMLMVNYLPLE